ncbi:MAG: TetR/AcrR family transcriptional regulator [Clostridia bacterium]|nr:TetR/AcrR family transcriptional regulator [Clostridia bacterium]
MPNEDLRERNVRNVLEQAVACFKELGIELTTLTEIARRAGVTARSIQRYFGTKDNLIQNAMSVLYEELYAEMRINVESEEFCKKNGFRQVIDLLLLRATLAKRNPYAINSVTEYEMYFTRQGNRFEDCAFSENSAYFNYVTERLKCALSKGITDGSIRADADEEAAVDLLSLAYKGLLQRVSIIYVNGDIQEQLSAQKYIDAFIKMVALTLQPKIGGERLR